MFSLNWELIRRFAVMVWELRRQTSQLSWIFETVIIAWKLVHDADKVEDVSTTDVDNKDLMLRWCRNTDVFDGHTVGREGVGGNSRW
jgi:hypothetical protein